MQINKNTFRDSLIDVANNQKQSLSWLAANAKRFGRESADCGQDLPMFVFTGIDKLKLKLMTLKNIFTL